MIDLYRIIWEHRIIIDGDRYQTKVGIKAEKAVFKHLELHIMAHKWIKNTKTQSRAWRLTIGDVSDQNLQI